MTDSRYARQLIAPGFHQPALGLPLLCLCPGEPDPLLWHLALVAGAMGVTEQTLALPEPKGSSVAEALRLLRLNPAAGLDLVTTHLGFELARSEDRGARPYVVVELTGASASFRAEAERLAGLGLNPIRFLERHPDGVVLSATPPPMGSWPPERGGAVAGVHGVEAAGHLLADYLAAAGAFVEPVLAEAMPRSPEWLECERVPPTSRPNRRLRVLLVGGGGALSHAFLEAVLHEPELVAALGLLVLVDPDTVELSNLSRQILYAGAAVGEPKASATARAFRQRLPGTLDVAATEVVAIPDRFAQRHLEQYRPDVVGLFPDAFEPRSSAFSALKRWHPGSLVLNAGTEFTYGTCRALTVGPGAPCCFDCGPEELASAALAEARDRAEQAGCGQEHTPSNVLTNLFAGALAARALAASLGDGLLPRGQAVVNWMLPERLYRGPALPSCGCWGPLRRRA